MLEFFNRLPTLEKLMKDNEEICIHELYIQVDCKKLITLIIILNAYYYLVWNK